MQCSAKRWVQGWVNSFLLPDGVRRRDSRILAPTFSLLLLMKELEERRRKEDRPPLLTSDQPRRGHPRGGGGRRPRRLVLPGQRRRRRVARGRQVTHGRRACWTPRVRCGGNADTTSTVGCKTITRRHANTSLKLVSFRFANKYVLINTKCRHFSTGRLVWMP